MMLREAVYAQAVSLAGDLEEQQAALLKVLCAAAVSSLTARLREGLTPEDCGEDFIAGASLFALGALNSAAEEREIQEFKAGDLTVKQGSGSREGIARCLYQQAELLMGPYLRSDFVFLGV